MPLFSHTFAGAHPADEPAPAGAAADQPIFEDGTGSTSYIPLNGGHRTVLDSVRTRVYVAADGGPPIVVCDTTNTVTTVTRKIMRGVIVGDSDSDGNDAMDVSDSSDDPPEDFLRALAASYAAAHTSASASTSAAAPSAAGSAHAANAAAGAAGTSAAHSAHGANAAAGAAGANAAGPSRGRGLTRSAAATRVRRRTFIGPRRQTVYVPSGSDNDTANAAVEDDAAVEADAADAAGKDDTALEDEAADTGKGKGKARA